VNPLCFQNERLCSPTKSASSTPIQGHSRFSVIFQGVYNAWDLPTSTFTPEAQTFFETMTDWSGELVKSRNGYDVAIIAVLGGGPFIHWNPLETWGVKGQIEFSEDCNTMFAEWPGGVDAWIWDTVPTSAGPPPTFNPPPIPWVTPVNYHPLTPDPDNPTPIYETYHRMIMPTD